MPSQRYLKQGELQRECSERSELALANYRQPGQDKSGIIATIKRRASAVLSLFSPQNLKFRFDPRLATTLFSFEIFGLDLHICSRTLM